MIYNKDGKVIKYDKSTMEHYHKAFTDPDTPITKDDIKMLNSLMSDEFIIFSED